MPWCPTCHMEYRPGFERCSDCHIELVEQQPEGADIPAPDLPEEWVVVSQKGPAMLKNLYARLYDIRLPELNVRSWMLVSVLFMLAFNALEVQLRRGLIQLAVWFFENFGLILRVLSLHSPPMSFVFPILLNLIFFCVAYSIVHKRSPLRYLTLRNAGIMAAITLGGIMALHLLGLLWLFIQFGGDPARNPDLIFNAREISMGVVYAHVLVHILLTVLPLAFIYRYTIGDLPLKKLLLSKTAIGALAISFMLFAVAYIYTAYFFDGYTVTLPTPPFGINARLFFMLHLLWAGLLLKEPAPKPEEDPPHEEPAAP